MRTLAALAAVTVLACAAAAAPMKDPTKLSWVAGAAEILRADAPPPSPRVPSPQARPAPAAGVSTGQPAAATGGEPRSVTQGRLAHVLRERKITLKKVWRGRRAKPRSDAPRRTAPGR